MSQIIRIRNLIESALDAEGVELVDLELKGNRKNQVLRIFVDTEGGIDLEKCVHLSHVISDLLDIEDLIPGRYRLEVSSPGVDRPLVSLRDFQRNRGREVRVNYQENSQHREEEGIIWDAREDIVYIKTEKGIVNIPLANIEKAKIKLKW